MFAALVAAPGSAVAVGFLVFAVFNAATEAFRVVVMQRLSALLTWDMSGRSMNVITMDVKMPRLDGLEATAAIMATSPARILIVAAVSAVLARDDDLPGGLVTELHVVNA